MAIGLAILGTGMVARYHQAAIAAHSEAHLIAVSHYDARKYPEIAAAFGVPCLAFDAILAHPDIQVVIICTPSGQHAEQAIRAAQAGKHVLVEKPMALSLPEADAMITACQKAQVKLGVVLQRRAEPMFQRIKQALTAGDLGRLNLAALTLPYYRAQSYYQQAAWRGTWRLDGGGVMMNQGIHLVDLLLWYLGDPVHLTSAAATLDHAIEVEDTLVATLTFADGTMATIAATTSAPPGFPHRLELYGSAGAIQVIGETVASWQLVNPDQAKIPPWVSEQAAAAGAGGDPRGISTSGHRRLLADFIEAICDNREPLVGGDEGRRSVKLILDLYAAAGLVGG